MATTLQRPAPAAASDDPLASVLLERQLLPPQDLARLLAESRQKSRFLEEVLITGGVLTRAQLLEILENHFFCPSFDATKAEFNPAALTLVPQGLATRHLILPLGMDGEMLHAAFANPDSMKAREAACHASSLQVAPQVALRHELRDAIELNYGRLAKEARAGETAKAAARVASVAGTRREAVTVQPTAGTKASRLELPSGLYRKDATTVVETLIELAIKCGATDIHVEPADTDFGVRLRVDGILHEAGRLPKTLQAPVTSRMKVMGGMDISERRVPQDGRCSHSTDDSAVDLRLSTLPSHHGEKVVARLLRRDSGLLRLERLGMPPNVRTPYEETLTSPQGFYLVTGPTGSGKTTTLYATLASLDRASINIVTLEDPIEYAMHGITQVQINEAAGLSFAAGLHSILRQDPDVVLVGEMRDLSTVEIACRAALTGHKVFSTLHTNDACQAVTRLLDMGTSPHLITATIRGVLAQRLVRVNCTACLETYEANDTEKALLGFPKQSTLQRGAGCEACAQTGYAGRMAVYEWFRLEENLHRMVMDRASPLALRHAAARNGMVSMADAGRRLVLDGRTTVTEIQRVILSNEGREQLCQGCQRAVSTDFANCPFCQQVLKEQCASCRQPIDPHWEACPSCGDPVVREWKRSYCPSCVAPLASPNDPCPYCSEDLR